jgi:sterol desaturase/sphingolipid hydroxylase (fatty acid hydroxylase superfamily)
VPPQFRTFSGLTWWSRSARNDYALVMINALVVAGAMVWLGAWMESATGGAWMASVFGPIGVEPAPWAPVALAATLFVVDDFYRYVVHYIEHRYPAMWELHKVHHTAEVLNFVTAERHHPISVLYYQIPGAVVTGAVNGVFLLLFSESVSPWSIVGANGFWILSNMLCSTLRHSPAWLSFGPLVENWIISPAQHQVHHSADPAHFDKNLGSTLAVWDRLFGTLHRTGPEREVTEFGIGAETADYRSLWALYKLPVLRFWQTLRSAA